MAMSLRDYVDSAMGNRLRVFRELSSHLAVNYPFLAESGIIDPRTQRKIEGLPVGYAGKEGEGGIFGYDHVQYYNAGLTTDVNVKRVGMVGKRKSSGVKSEIYLGSIVGYNHMVMDPKGEYTPLAEAIEGGKVLRFGPGSNLTINPLDPGMDPKTRYQLIESMCLIGLKPRRPELTTYQESLLEEAINEVIGLETDAEEKGLVAVLGDLVAKLQDPSEHMIEHVGLPERQTREISNELALALRKYDTGRLAGPFSGKTTPGMFDPTSLLVLNCENPDEELAAVILIVLNFLTQGEWGRKQGSRFHKVYHDEAWDLSRYPGHLASLVRAFKLGGTWGVSNNIIMHDLSNLFMSGDTVSAEALINDSSLTIIYTQTAAQIEPYAKALALTNAEVNQILRYQPGEAMYKIGREPGITVNHNRVTGLPHIRELVETRASLRDE